LILFVSFFCLVCSLLLSFLFSQKEGRKVKHHKKHFLSLFSLSFLSLFSFLSLSFLSRRRFFDGTNKKQKQQPKEKHSSA